MRQHQWIAALTPALLLLGMASFASAAPAAKIEVCHFPPGNPDNFHTITISEKAFSAHLAHGDLGEACNALCATICDDGNKCTIDDTADCEEVGCPTSSTPVDCNDQNGCTADSCDIASGCVNTARLGETCDDAQVCSGPDTCNAAGACEGAAIDNCCLGDEDCSLDLCDQASCDLGTNRCGNEPVVCTPPDLCTMSECASDSGQCVDAAVVCPLSQVCNTSGNCCEMAVMREWGTAAYIERADNGNAINPQVAMDSSGNAVAVWQQLDGPTIFGIGYNRYDAQSGSWGGAQWIEGRNNGNAINPQVAMDSSGNAVAVWQQLDGPTIFGIGYNRYDAQSGSWGGAQWIEGRNNGNAINPQVAMDSSGNAVAVWQQLDGPTIFGIGYNRYDAQSGSWGGAQWIEGRNNGNAINPQVAMDSSGNAVAVWQQLDGFLIDSIGSNRYDAQSGSWGTAAYIERADINNRNAAAPQVAMDSSGNAVAVWQQLDGFLIDSIGSNRYDAQSGSWGTAAYIERADINNRNAAAPQVAMDSSGNAVAVWQQLDGFLIDSIGSNRYDAQSGSWGTAAYIERADINNRNAAAPQVAMDSSGNAVAVWQQLDGFLIDSIGSNRYDAQSGSWGTAAYIERADINNGNAAAPQVAMDSCGNAVGVWQQLDGSLIDSIVSNRFE